MAILTFDTLSDISEHFNGPVFEDTLDQTLLVKDELNHRWLRYRWSHGKREIQFLEDIESDDMPIMLQIYPKF